MTLIYLVEDDRATREQLAQGLLPLGRVVSFSAAEAALAAYEERVPDLFVTDVRLPGLSGLDLARRVRSRHGRLELPILIVSGVDELEEVAQGYEAGVDDYLIKPVTGEELQHKAQVFLSRGGHRSREEPEWRRYELLEQVGKGQTAATYRARRRSDGACVALKVVGPGASPAVAALLREAKLLRDLEEVPGVVRVKDMGSEAGHTYYAMDLLSGGTLADRLRGGRLSAPQAARCCRSLATTLVALAGAEVVHGDLKPVNVVFAGEAPVLVDFGLARRVGEEGVSRGGTLAYLAPEVVRGGEATYQSDLYSLGVLLFECLSGELPYSATGSDLAALKVEGSPPDLGPLLELDLAPGLVAIAEEALAPDPARRTRRASELAVALLPYSGR